MAFFCNREVTQCLTSQDGYVFKFSNETQGEKI